MNSPTRACLIDASIYIFRAYFSLPDRWHSPQGWPLNAVYGYSAFLLDFFQAADDLEYCAAAFDESLGTCFRNDIYPDYKASRVLPDEALAFQLETCREVTERLGIPAFGGSRYEADDYLATLVRLLREQRVGSTLVTRDKDLGQLLRDQDDRWWDFAAGRRLDAADFEQKFGVPPCQFADYLALVGDPVDDIPGVPGVGAKTAARLLQEFDGLDDLGGQLDRVATLDIRGAGKLQQRLQEHWPQVLMSRKLTGLEANVPGLNAAPVFKLEADPLLGAADFLVEIGIDGALPARFRRLADQREAA